MSMYSDECKACLEGFLEERNVVCPNDNNEALIVLRADESGESGTVQCDCCLKKFKFDGVNLIPMGIRTRKGA